MDFLMELFGVPGHDFQKLAGVSYGDNEVNWLTKDGCLTLLSRGCVGCGKKWLDDARVKVIFTDQDKQFVKAPGMSLVEAVEWRLMLTHECYGPKGVSIDHASAEVVYLVERRAAVCFRCWVNFLQQAVNKLNEGTPQHG